MVVGVRQAADLSISQISRFAGIFSLTQPSVRFMENGTRKRKKSLAEVKGQRSEWADMLETIEIQQ